MIKKETSDKYQATLGGLRNTVMMWIMERQDTMSPARLEKMQVLYEKIRKVENRLLDGDYRTSDPASNAIKALVMTVDRWKGVWEDGADEDSVDAPIPKPVSTVKEGKGKVVEEKVKEPEPVLTGTAEQLMKFLETAHANLMDGYNFIVEKHRMNARVPDIIRIKASATEVSNIMQCVAKMGADL